MKINNNIKPYNCVFCGKNDNKTYKEAREGRLIVICENCNKKEGDTK